MELEDPELAEQSRTDPLTGLPNRRALSAALKRAIGAAHAIGSPLAVALVDVDHFKMINDLHGHAEGDRVLANIAQSLHSQRGAHGMVARFGGEEFALLLPGVVQSTAELQCDFVREAVQNLALGLPVTVRIGMTMLAPGDDTHSICVRRNGRNRVETGAGA